MSPLEMSACQFATHVHEAAGNTRKFVGGPYIQHPAEVVTILRRYTDDPVTLAAGWLHDVKDDAGVTLATLVSKFGVEVAEVVECVSADPSSAGQPRAERVAISISKVAGGPARAHDLRAADIISNCRSIAQRNPRFARTYLPEKAATLRQIDKAHPDLLAEAWRVVCEAGQALTPVLELA